MSGEHSEGHWVCAAFLNFRMSPEGQKSPSFQPQTESGYFQPPGGRKWEVAILAFQSPSDSWGSWCILSGSQNTHLGSTRIQLVVFGRGKGELGRGAQGISYVADPSSIFIYCAWQSHPFMFLVGPVAQMESCNCPLNNEGGGHPSVTVWCRFLIIHCAIEHNAIVLATKYSNPALKHCAQMASIHYLFPQEFPLVQS